MSIELRILSGSRAGQTQMFEKSVIAVGRHPMSDLQFDANQDLDVSTRHGEIRGIDGRYTIHDSDSTNGTFVNGQRIAKGGSRELRSGDVIGFGAHGPTVSVRIADSKTTPIGDRVTEVVPTPALGIPKQAPIPPRRPTTERVAIAVAEQTRGLKIAVAAAIVVFGGLGAGLYWMGHREAAASDAKLQTIMAAYDQSSKDLQARVAATNDTTLIRNLQHQRDSLMKAAREAKGGEAAVIQQAIQRKQTAARAIGEMDAPALVGANNPGLAFIRADIGDEAFEATGFNVAANGVIVTNRHVVENPKGKATKILVKFADTPTWLRAHLVRVPSDTSIDLALLQIDDPGKYPAVSGVASTVDVPVGAAIASIGFPLGSDLPMAGSRATTTLLLGTVSKTVPDLLQIDSYASHGSSGSPVFDGHGHVIGVIYGGPREAAGRIVYAVPAAQLSALINNR
jgi:S1-C subfamily serine protease